MDLLSPEPGLVIWTGLTFLILLFLLKKYAWKPLLSMIQEREDKIATALESAKKANQEYQRMEEAKAQMEADARKERDELLKEARAMKDSIVEEARKAAQDESEKIIADARLQIEKEKASAISELKQQVVKLSADIAGKILLVDNLQVDGRQEKLIEKYLQDSNFN